MTPECGFGTRCSGGLDNPGHVADPATHVVMLARTDEPVHEVLWLCTEDAKRYVGGSIEVANGPQLIAVGKLP